ncbi:DNA-binding transcriptional MerR regulator [Rhizobium aquaticum]|uniref:DNA-binding transcriptional MerR regulator n=1 Tax=Rhizobium aquaticum TaxID=1549636 RepID=A0ABV2IUX3_9HYPH
MMTIGKLSITAGVKVPTIRYYEEIGLMPEPERTEGNQRRYIRAHLERLNFIRHARDLGFSVEAIRDLLSLQATPDAPCHDADRIAADNLADVRAKIARLKKLEAELEHIVSECAGGRAGECNVLSTLADHALCMTDHGHAHNSLHDAS